MRDEEFVFMSDVREKKRTATGAFHKRTHAGKGGAVKFPYDFLTRKELNAMNGEVKSYNINSPMTWTEFKDLPDDIKIIYIKLLREKFDVPDARIADTLGVRQQCLAKTVVRLGIGCGRKSKHKNFDADAFNAWVNGKRPDEEADPGSEATFPETEETTVDQDSVLEGRTFFPAVKAKPVKVIPGKGSFTWEEANIDDVLDYMRSVLAGAVGTVAIAWKLKGDNGGKE